MRSSRSAVPRQRAFTLVELLVSVVVLGLLTLALFNLLNASTTTWNRAEQQNDAYREARAALDLIASDLSSMAADDAFPASATAYRETDARSKVDTLIYGRGGAPANLKASEPADADANDPPPSSITFEFAAGDSLGGAGMGDVIFFLARLPLSSQPSTTPAGGGTPQPAKSPLCTVGYYLAYTMDRAPQPGETLSAVPRSYKILRHLANADATFTRLSTPDRAIVAQPNPASQSSDEVLARNVVGLKMTLYRARGDGTLEPRDQWPTRAFVEGSGPTKRVLPAAPAMIDLEITTLGSQSSGLLSRKEDWESGSRFSAIINRSKQSFRTRVFVRR